MSVHYKFKSALEYDTVTFDGLHISVKDLKNSIVQQKRIGKNTDFDLQVTNAQTKEVYEDEHALIPKNTSLLIARIPLAVQNKAKTWEGYGNDSVPTPRSDEGGPAAKAVDLSSLDASEDDKIRAMMSQSTQDYDPSNYMKIRGANQVGIVPPNYRCYKCHQMGHWIKDCPLGQGTEQQIEIKKSTGIPRSFMVPVEGPQVQGAMMTPYGSYAVPVLDHQTYTQKPLPPSVPAPVQKTDIPEDLVCTICSDLLTDAVMIPCCGNSFCDECIRSSLLESEEHECPDCHEREISPGTLIPNRFLRNSVSNFKNTTGYVKRQIYKPAVVQSQQQTNITTDKEVKSPELPEELKTENGKVEPASESTEKTVISEADSTEAPKTPISESTNKEESETKPQPEEEKVPVDLPPGVSPVREKTPESHPITVNTQHRERSHGQSKQQSSRHSQKSERSPRRPPKQRSPAYQDSAPNIEERPGTPTVDEPGMGGVTNNDESTYQSTNAPYPSGPPPPVVMPASIGPPHHIQVPPPGMNQPSTQYPPPVQQYPPSQNMIPHGPPPNFRMPPPGSNPPPNFMPGMYNVPQRPMFDPTRPPIQGPPPNYQNYSSRPRARDYPPRSLRGRTPPGIIDDPLEAFNRMLREKDERERRAKQRKVRSYSRSSSRSYSRSPRRRSRTPRRRSRSRSKSFTISRSRSRSYSPANRASPYRDYSPRRRPPSRYRTSPQRSPSRYRYKEAPDRLRERDYDRDRERDRERERDRDRDRDYGMPKRENTRAYSRDRPADYHYYDNFERDKAGPPRGASKWAPPRDGYYPQEHQSMGYHQAAGPVQQHPVPNRYPREQYPPYKPEHIPPLLQQPIIPPRRYEDVAPPGTEQPLPPGEEPTPRYEDRYNLYDNRSRPEPQLIAEHYAMESHDKYQEPEKYMREDRYPENRDMEVMDRRGYSEKPREEREKEKRHEQYNRSPRRSKDRNESPDKHKRKKRDESPEKVKREEKEKEKEKEKERDKEKEKRRDKDHSEDEKGKKTKEKKKKRDKKESEKKKKKDKKEKREHKKEEKEKAKHDKEKKEDTVKTVSETPVAENVKVVPKELSPPKTQESPAVEQEPPPPVVDEEEQLAQPAPTESPKRLQEADLYGDILSEGIDNSIVQSYGKIDEARKKSVSPVDRNKSPDVNPRSEHSDDELPETHETSKEYEDVLELYTGELKSELDKEMLAPLPEKSKWELDDEPNHIVTDDQQEIKTEKSNKVTNEVLKRAENAIFAKAINAIRPIEIKKISLDRAKLYSGEKDDKKEEEPKAEQVLYHFEESASATNEPAKTDAEPVKPARLSVKERLGCKVDELDRIVRVDRSYDRNRSRTLSPLAKRSQDIRNERRVEVDDKRRERERLHERDRHHRNYRNNDRRDRNDTHRRDDRRDNRVRNRTRDREIRDKDRKERSRSSKVKDDEKRDKTKRTRSRSEDKKDKHKKREKKQKKERPKKHHKKEDEQKESTENNETKAEPAEKPKPATTEKRKATLDEANFVPDYDMETDTEEDKTKENKKRLDVNPPDPELAKKRPKIEEKHESSSSESSSSSSEDEKKKKKHKKHRKRKRKESTSSSSDSESSSSEDEKDRKKKKHKRKQKKKKKSKHK